MDMKEEEDELSPELIMDSTMSATAPPPSQDTRSVTSGSGSGVPVAKPPLVSSAPSLALPALKTSPHDTFNAVPPPQ
ncbi:hypothetical protein PQX77_014414 [Marasmius sp. AFHP31]|nr:hypothetical protein PQX77_014414 [Marasmius sp. AFHP31]